MDAIRTMSERAGNDPRSRMFNIGAVVLLLFALCFVCYGLAIFVSPGLAPGFLKTAPTPQPPPAATATLESILPPCPRSGR